MNINIYYTIESTHLWSECSNFLIKFIQIIYLSEIDEEKLIDIFKIQTKFVNINYIWQRWFEYWNLHETLTVYLLIQMY